MDRQKLCSVLIVPFLVGQSPTKATFVTLDLSLYQACVLPDKERYQVQIAHSTQVKFKSPTLGKAFSIKCPTPQAWGGGGGGGKGC